MEVGYGQLPKPFLSSLNPERKPGPLPVIWVNSRAGFFYVYTTVELLAWKSLPILEGNRSILSESLVPKDSFQKLQPDLTEGTHLDFA